MEDKPFETLNIDLFPRITKVANFIKNILTISSPPLRESNHYNPEHFGAAAMLDEALYQPELGFDNTPHAVSEGWISPGWDSEGRYINPSEY